MIVKKITYYKGEGVFEMSRFTLPRDIYHGKGCLEELKNLKGKKAILVVGGGSMKRNRKCVVRSSFRRNVSFPI